jgi:hypothetical protein
MGGVGDLAFQHDPLGPQPWVRLRHRGEQRVNSASVSASPTMRPTHMTATWSLTSLTTLRSWATKR